MDDNVGISSNGGGKVSVEGDVQGIVMGRFILRYTTKRKIFSQLKKEIATLILCLLHTCACRKHMCVMTSYVHNFGAQ